MDNMINFSYTTSSGLLQYKGVNTDQSQQTLTPWTG